jgi:autotransporter translocation and assembly factor TamB
VDLQGPLDLRLTLNVERRGVALERVPPQVLDLLADERGRLAVPLRVSGTREEPDVAVDVQALLSRAGEGIGRRLGGRPSDLLDRLLRP